ncbi:MAG: hypothetical protein K6F61_08015 [Clostridiales bacterium]|nr:hypothetical protein [Clostridiales bacterium]
MKRISIIFPGLGYTADKPLLYYGLDVACAAGYGEYRKLSFAAQHNGSIRGISIFLEDSIQAPIIITINLLSFQNCLLRIALVSELVHYPYWRYTFPATVHLINNSDASH